MRTTFQIIAALLTVITLSIIGYAMRDLIDFMGPSFAAGMLFAFAIMALVYLIGRWVDGSTPANTASCEHQGSRRTIDL
ncbi:MAG: hypothetical protein R3D70_09290 [Rhizobiaceae bacterium]